MILPTIFIASYQLESGMDYIMKLVVVQVTEVDWPKVVWAEIP